MLDQVQMKGTFDFRSTGELEGGGDGGLEEFELGVFTLKTNASNDFRPRYAAEI